MPSSAGNSRLSHPEICSGDHWSASFCATRHRSSGQLARRQGFGRSALSQASESASLARYALRPPCRLTSRVTVEGARPSLAAILRIDRPAAIPRSEEHTSELQSRLHLVCRLLLEKKKKTITQLTY